MITRTNPEASDPAVDASVAKPLDSHDRSASNQKAGLRVRSGTRQQLALASGLVATLLSGAIFGFFYAWVCSVMYGLDAADPRVAIQAMQSVNATVRNPVFFPSFFLTPVALAAAALLSGSRRPAMCFGLAAVVYATGGAGLTAVFNIPMNNDLAQVAVPSTVPEAQAVWNAYSADWQVWNLVRTVFAGFSLGLAGLGLANLRCSHQ